MAYQASDLITASHYNGFIGSGGTSVYASQSAVNAVAPCVGAIYGAGYGDRGWGQTDISLSAVAGGDIITSAKWLGLRNVLATIRASQTGSVPSTVPAASVFDVGDMIQAHESSSPTSDPYDFNSEIVTADANRSAASTLSVIVVGGTSSATRSGTWGSSTGGIELVFDVSWPSTDQARYFFNTGGQIRISLSHPTGTAQDNNWNSALSTRVGQINVLSHQTAMQGSLGTSAALGYFEATGSDQTIFNAVVTGTSPYAANTLTLKYRALGTAANGGPGSGLRFTIRLTDGHINAFADSVASGTIAAFTVAKNTYLGNPSLTTPTGSVSSAWTVV